MPDDVTPTPTPTPTRVRRRTRRLGRVALRFLLLVVVPAIAILIGTAYYVAGQRYVSTENAYVKADKIAISADIAGRVVKVAVKENAIVEPGQLLFQVDPEPFEIALAESEAKMANIVQVVEAMRAEYRTYREELEIAQVNLTYHQRELDRRTELLRTGALPQAKYDEGRRAVDVARQEMGVLRQRMARAIANLSGDINLPVASHPRYLEAKAARDEAARNLRHALVVAPTGGVVSRIELQAGEYVRSGTPVFSLVTADDLWIEANMKETDLTHVLVGQDAKISIDTYPDREWAAVVTSISPATGAEFALLPPQNATGNWVKVVQRIPVRLILKEAQGDPTLRAGMSVKVEIDTKYEPQLPGIVKRALAWVAGD
ncbi:MAG: HlyD family secretion protein [Alphaproteobacteria bacterium]|nr:HlyD family secretion protein [Alphaproteobacteria bacterium]